jgi:exodeoxyribonuclease-5
MTAPAPPPSIDLTPEQQDAFDRILLAAHPANTHRVVSLCGYAGTGKTTLIGVLCRQLQAAHITTLLCAPTHKALRQLESSVGADVVSATLASLLSKKKKRDMKGGWDFVSSEPPESIRLRYSFLKNGVLIIDEASMISEEDADLIIAIFGGYCRAIIFAGDARQLPPVEETQTPLMNVEEDAADISVRLETVVRHGGGILELATALRSVPHGLVPFGRFSSPDVQLYEDETRWLDCWLKSGGIDAKALAFTNKRVAELNRGMLTDIYGHEEGGELIYHIGQRLLTQEGVSNDGNTGLLFPSTTEIEILGLEYTSAPVGEHGDTGIPVVLMEVRAPETDAVGVLSVVDTIGLPCYEAELRRLKTAAIQDRAGWRTYYAFAERFTNVQPAYALTVHKSQGSTYTDVFLDIRDIQTNSRRDMRMMNRLAYVGASRAQRSLHILM